MGSLIYGFSHSYYLNNKKEVLFVCLFNFYKNCCECLYEFLFKDLNRIVVLTLFKSPCLHVHHMMLVGFM